MSRPRNLAESVPGASVLQAITDLYDKGLILQAYRMGEQTAPVSQWRGTAARIMGGRMMMNLGAPRLGQVLHVRAFREDPADPEAAYYFARALSERRGPLAAIAFCRKIGELPDAANETRADWLAFQGNLAAIYRDFDSADDLISTAERLAPGRAWICIERGRMLECQDRYEEALAATRRSYEIQPWFRSGVQAEAHLLQILDRDEEALALLQEASHRIESASLLQQLASLQDHLHRHRDALETLTRINDFCPIREKQFQQGLAWVRSNIAYHDGNFSEAITFAEQADHEFMRKVAEKLRQHVESGQPAQRVLLEFPFVRQHHMTCAPATMSAIGQFWKREADHLAVVDAICYDGTPSYSQRNWAQSNGWLTREFTITWEAAVALIDRGLPFTLATVQVTSGHLQAVIGYDKMRGTLLCRDPYQYYITEFSFDLLLKHNAASGPRGMVMVPEPEAHRLKDLPLPDSELFDLLHEMEAALSRHERAAAEDAYSKLTAAVPGHRLAHHARRALGAYDSDPADILEAIEGLLSLYPDDQPLLFAKIHVLQSLERRDLALPILQKLCDTQNSDPIFLQYYANELRQDFGDDDRVLRLLRKQLRLRPTDPAGLYAMANALWGRQKREEATALYRLCACAGETNETGAQTYFNASRHLRQTKLALAMLERRFQRLGKRSSQPGCTLFWALELLDRVPEALVVLEQAQGLRPDDGNLLLYAASAHGRRGNLLKAHALLDAAAGKTHHNAWLRRAAEIASYEGDLAKALELWREVLSAEPLANDANNAVAQLIAETQSPDAAARHLAEVHERFPHSISLQQTRITWLRSLGAAAVTPVARELVEQRPGNVWARVELALCLTRLGEPEEALKQANAALALAPDAANAHNAAGQALRSLKRIDEARAAFRRAIEISIDFTAGMYSLFESYSDIAGQREAIAFIRQELVRQVIFGEGLIAFRQLASSVLEPDDLLASLREALAARPDLWHAWSAITIYLTEINQLDEALSMAKQAVDRFPLLPRAWFDLGHVCSLRADRAGQIDALNHCLQLSPDWSAAARRLSQALQNAGDIAKAQAVLERAIARDPLTAENHESLARLLWNIDKQAEAISRCKQAVLLNPWLNSGWDSLKFWATQTNGQADLVEFARDVCKRRPGEAVAWLVLARVLDGPDTMTERIEACNAAIARAPHNSEAHDLKACLLLEHKHVDEAIKACDPAEFEGHAPVDLRGRRAWIHAQQGDRKLAIEQMQKLVQENNGYHWGWRQLVYWLSLEQSSRDYLVCAREMMEAFPHDPLAQNHLAEAQLRAKDRGGAKATMLHALSVSPDNTYALNKVFGMQIQDKEFDDAQNTLKLMKQHTAPEFYTSRVVMLAAARGETNRAREAFGKLCFMLKDDEQLLTEAVSAMSNAGMRSAINQECETVVFKDRNIRPYVVEVWSHWMGYTKQWTKCLAIMDLFEEETPQWNAAASSYIHGLAKAKHIRRINSLIRNRRAALRKHTRVWGGIGYALFFNGKSRRCIRWLNDWAQRKDAEPWILINLVGALRRLGKDQEAVNVGRFATTLRPDATTPKHIVWLAFDEAISGYKGPYTTQLANIDLAKLDWYYPLINKLGQALLQLCNPAGVASGENSKAARHQIAAAAGQMPKWSSQRELARAMRRAIRRVIAHDGRLINRWWGMVWFIRSLNFLK
ncbi:MAG TPA: tetratricopeptide repeat protein [Tepidisphaeraceae bacterium]|nr:tetratricopeptide repeat protein [Tepidisphaeraceae bacterium]